MSPLALRAFSVASNVFEYLVFVSYNAYMMGMGLQFCEHQEAIQKLASSTHHIVAEHLHNEMQIVFWEFEEQDEFNERAHSCDHSCFDGHRYEFGYTGGCRAKDGASFGFEELKSS